MTMSVSEQTRPRREPLERIGHVNPLAVAAEAARAVLSQPALSSVTGLVVAAAVTVILATTGQTAAAERQVLSRIADASSRTVEITDASNSGVLRSDLLPVIAGLSTTDWVVGLGTPQDGRNHAIGPGAEPVTSWPLFGSLPPDVHVSHALTPGQALIGRGAVSAFGSSEGLGALDLPAQRQVPAVGLYDASGPLAFLNDGSIVSSEPSEDQTVQRILIAAEQAADVTALTAAALGIIAPDDPSSVRVNAPASLEDLEKIVAGDLGTYGRGLLLVVLISGLVLVGICVLGQVLVRRRDLGRRRALGATRSTLVALVILQCTCAATLGATGGTAAGLLLTWRTAESLPGAAFVLGAATLAVLGAAVAAVPAAAAAALRDPISVLRTP